MVEATSSSPFDASSLPFATVDPNFLNSNSTSHQWAFGAIAELIDNAVDPDVRATQFVIDYQQFELDDGGVVDALVCMDNGSGLDPKKLGLMLGFGHSDKLKFGNNAIGQYGNGFKSGTMRLGRDVLVLTKDRQTELLSVGFLSQTFLKAINADRVLIPMVTWTAAKRRVSVARDGSLTDPDASSDQSMASICAFSVFRDEESMLDQLDVLEGHGTIIVITGLRKLGDRLELDFTTDITDIRILPDDFRDEFGSSANASRNHMRERPAQPQATDVILDYSLRAYVQVLYKIPRMQIFLRNQRVRTHRITSFLRLRAKETYRPREPSVGNTNLGAVDIEMGFHVNDLRLYGMMLYHRGRLIEYYKRVGIQLEPNGKGVGVMGVVDCNMLTPTHNKQAFETNHLYKRLLFKLGEILKLYWFEKVERNGPPKEFKDQLAIASGAVTPPSAAAPQQAASAPRARRAPAPRAPAPAPLPIVQGGDVLWAQCDNPLCLKWRMLPPGTRQADLPDVWMCENHPDPAKAALGCSAREDENQPAPLVDLHVAKKHLRDYENEERQAKKLREHLAMQIRLGQAATSGATPNQPQLNGSGPAPVTSFPPPQHGRPPSVAVPQLSQANPPALSHVHAPPPRLTVVPGALLPQGAHTAGLVPTVVSQPANGLPHSHAQLRPHSSLPAQQSAAAPSAAAGPLATAQVLYRQASGPAQLSLQQQVQCERALDEQRRYFARRASEAAAGLLLPTGPPPLTSAQEHCYKVLLMQQRSREQVERVEGGVASTLPPQQRVVAQGPGTVAQGSAPAEIDANRRMVHEQLWRMSPNNIAASQAPSHPSGAAVGAPPGVVVGLPLEAAPCHAVSVAAVPPRAAAAPVHAITAHAAPLKCPPAPGGSAPTVWTAQPAQTAVAAPSKQHPAGAGALVTASSDASATDSDVEVVQPAPQTAAGVPDAGGGAASRDPASRGAAEAPAAGRGAGAARQRTAHDHTLSAERISQADALVADAMLLPLDAFPRATPSSAATPDASRVASQQAAPAGGSGTAPGGSPDRSQQPPAQPDALRGARGVGPPKRWAADSDSAAVACSDVSLAAPQPFSLAVAADGGNQDAPAAQLRPDHRAACASAADAGVGGPPSRQPSEAETRLTQQLKLALGCLTALSGYRRDYAAVCRMTHAEVARLDVLELCRRSLQGRSDLDFDAVVGAVLDGV